MNFLERSCDCLLVFFTFTPLPFLFCLRDICICICIYIYIYIYIQDTEKHRVIARSYPSFLPQSWILRNKRRFQSNILVIAYDSRLRKIGEFDVAARCNADLDLGKWILTQRGAQAHRRTGAQAHKNAHSLVHSLASLLNGQQRIARCRIGAVSRSARAPTGMRARIPAREKRRKAACKAAREMEAADSIANVHVYRISSTTRVRNDFLLEILGIAIIFNASAIVLSVHVCLRLRAARLAEGEPDPYPFLL